MSAPTTFDEATKIASDPDILKIGFSDKSKIYGYFKIASTASATPTEPRPGMFRPQQRTKWDAWKSAGETIIPEGGGGSEEDTVRAAKLRYTNVVRVAMGADELGSLSS